MMRPIAVRLLMAAVCLTVAGSLVAAFAVIGSPSTQRARTLDGVRVGDLDMMRYAINAYADQHKALPARLADLDLAVVRRDPQTQEPYGYKVTGTSTYQLCASFQTSSGSDADDAWKHDAGLHCFTRSRDSNNAQVLSQDGP